MGIERVIRYPAADTPTWQSIKGMLARAGEHSSLRMIDNMPAFPDEEPAAGWKELRIGISGGMVTIRRAEGLLSCVVWGNADTVLAAAWAKVIWACAAAGRGTIETEEGPVDHEQFARAKGLAL
jgi:hypothetical protein